MSQKVRASSAGKELQVSNFDTKRLVSIIIPSKNSERTIADCLKSIASRFVASRRKILSYDPLNVAIRFVRRDVFDSVGGFDPDLYAGEDLDFHQRFLNRGYKMVYSPATEWHLGSPANFKGLLNRSLYYSSNN